jgi:uncharacterized SAM-binding protein YcdF (DUF218 family)
MTESSWQRRRRLGLTAISAVLLSGGAAWGLGFAIFTNIAWQTSETPKSADGIVVLTGGANRIETALRLLADGRAPLLLVSGVAVRADLTDIDHHVPLDADQAARVTLGHAAQSTSGNAAETALWSRAHGIKRLIVVTAGYHMPRALLELRRALPDVELNPVPVQAPTRHGAARTRSLASEYDKLLAVRFGLDRLLHNGGV